MTFEKLKIIPVILKALEEEGYTTPTDIQIQAIPPILEGRDIMGSAQTGTGKTAAFAVPTMQRLLESGEKARDMNKISETGNRIIVGKNVISKRKIRSLILTPTRELAMQIYESFCAYGRYTGLRATVVFGGVSQKPQVEALKRGIDILVATPGRLCDLMGQGLINLNNVEVLTLDEADRMLDMGFSYDVKRIISKTPANRQTLFFSATMPFEIIDMSNAILKNPAKIDVTPEFLTVETIQQSVYMVDKENKRNLLLHLLKNPAIESALVFTRTKHGADRVVKELFSGHINAAAIHGNKSQGARQMALDSFKKKKTRVLVATDIAARGIDIDSLSHVINFDLPEDIESYVHRIGRTGRAGNDGIAISFCDYDERPLLKAIEKLCSMSIPVNDENPYPSKMLMVVPRPEGKRRIRHYSARGRR